MMRIRRVTDEFLMVEEGSLYPALHPMEQNGWVRASWAVTNYGRKVNWYALTRAGRAQLASREKSGPRFRRMKSGRDGVDPWVET